MRKLGITIAVLAGVGLSLAAGFFAWAATAKYTECYGSFESRADADRAAEAARERGLEADLAEGDASRSVIFETGETGSDAASPRAVFREVLRSHGGEAAHPGDGCVERTHFN